ncbi:capsular polysaccharide synthesis protein [Leuconostoc gelidum]|uniref:capsular polysaccharide synthesis protein n=1 Tax=Leuconostoc gelidum TaxID=1244 RepID=UPI001CC3D1AA|nr:capsular polysaccharide synthesis protein [Leuconostoc gelidum]MBZ5986781.1 glycosyl transferase [Leuconostoc gelidum subsp. gelidum]
MSKLYKKGREFLSTGQGLLLLVLLPFFFKGETNHRILQLKLELSLKKKIKKIIKSSSDITFSTEVNKKIQNFDESSIWFMWLQGVDTAPELVKNNFFYLKKCFGNRVKLVTEENINTYLNIPDVIYKKWKQHVISNTHFSDIVRVQLLVTYGGLWIDSTVLVQESFITSIDSKSFVIPRTFPPGSNGKVISVSSWLIKSEKNNKFLREVQNKLIYYWTRENYLINYFLLHYILIITSEQMDNYLEKTYPVDNTLPHYLMLQMRERKISKKDMQIFLNQFGLIKLTNKSISELEKNNYKTLNSVVRTKGSNDAEPSC